MEEFSSRENKGGIDVYHAVDAKQKYEKSLQDLIKDTVDLQRMHEILRLFSENVFENTELFTTENGTKFPYTSINLVDFAKKILGRNSENATSTTQGNPEMHFIFGSSIMSQEDGESTVFIEDTLLEVIQKLPDIIKALHDGKPVKNTIIYNVGLPTNTKGFISELFIKDVEKNGVYPTFGKMYSEFIQRNSGENKRNIVISGTSMASNFAAEAGKDLVTAGYGTQDPKNTQKPQVRIEAESPVSFRPNSVRKPFRIAGGFGRDIITAGARGVYEKTWDRVYSLLGPINVSGMTLLSQETVTKAKERLTKLKAVEDAKKRMRERFDAILPGVLDEEEVEDQNTKKNTILRKLLLGLSFYTPPAGIKIDQNFGTEDSAISIGKMSGIGGGEFRKRDGGHVKNFFGTEEHAKSMKKLLEALSSEKK